MDLNELKDRLEISAEDTKQDKYLKIALEDAIEAVQTHCKDSFIDLETKELKIPAGVKRAIAKLIKAYRDKNGNVQSQSLGDMRKSFFEGGTMNEVTRLLKPYVKKKVRFL